MTFKNSIAEPKEQETDFWKQAYYSIHPTLEETGIGIGGFKKPVDVDLNVNAGDYAEFIGDDVNNGLHVKIIKYAGEKPWWKGNLFCEGYGPCWIATSLDKPFEIPTGKDYPVTRLLQTLPVPDYMLVKIADPSYIKGA